jgi:hypothetical protein
MTLAMGRPPRLDARLRRGIVWLLALLAVKDARAGLAEDCALLSNGMPALKLASNQTCCPAPNAYTPPYEFMPNHFVSFGCTPEGIRWLSM